MNKKIVLLMSLVAIVATLESHCSQASKPSQNQSATVENDPEFDRDSEMFPPRAEDAKELFENNQLQANNNPLLQRRAPAQYQVAEPASEAPSILLQRRAPAPYNNAAQEDNDEDDNIVSSLVRLAVLQRQLSTLRRLRALSEAVTEARDEIRVRAAAREANRNVMLLNPGITYFAVPAGNNNYSVFAAF